MTNKSMTTASSCQQLLTYGIEWPNISQPTVVESVEQPSFYTFAPQGETSEQSSVSSEAEPIPLNYTCMFCERHFNHTSKLKRHIAYMHGSAALQKCEKKFAKEAKSFKFKCSYCSRNFNTASHYNFHVRRAHNGLPAVKKQHSCILCKKYFDRKQLITHYCEEHNVKLETENLKFANMDAFIDWKTDMENEKSVKFISSRGKKIYGNATHYFYSCHHSGYYSSYCDKGVGTNKINSVCPASITVTEADASGECSVTFMKTHVGHSPHSSEFKEALKGLMDLGEDSKNTQSSIDKRHRSLKKKLIRLLNSISKDSEYDFLDKVVNSAELALNVMKDDWEKNGKPSIEINPEVLMYTNKNPDAVSSTRDQETVENIKEVAVTFTLKQLDNADGQALMNLIS